MANSSYYLGLYQTACSKVTDLSGRIQKAKTIRNNLRDRLDSYQSGTNGKLSALQEDLEAAVRHDSTYTGNISSLSDVQKEKATSSDSKLGAALNAMEAELSSLERQKSSAESDKSTCWQRYLEEKNREEEEARAYWDAWNRAHGL